MQGIPLGTHPTTVSTRHRCLSAFSSVWTILRWALLAGRVGFAPSGSQAPSLVHTSGLRTDFDWPSYGHILFLTTVARKRSYSDCSGLGHITFMTKKSGVRLLIHMAWVASDRGSSTKRMGQVWTTLFEKRHLQMLMLRSTNGCYLPGSRAHRSCIILCSCKYKPNPLTPLENDPMETST